VSVLSYPSISAILALPLMLVAMSFTRASPVVLRRAAIVVAISMLAASVPLLFGVSAERTLVDPLDQGRLLGLGPLWRVNLLAAPLVPFAIGVWLFLLSLAPRRARTRSMIRNSALGVVTTLATFLTENEPLLALWWAGSVAVLLADVYDPRDRRLFRVLATYLGASALSFAAGVVALALGADDAGIVLIAIAVVIRKGIVPAHSWVPELFERGKLGSAILFSIPQGGAYVGAVILLPRASESVLSAIVVLSLVTGVLGAALALVQADSHRAFGYLFVSQSAFVMTGLETSSVAGITSGLCLWLSSGAAFTGLALTVWVLEARRGRLDLTKYHGGYEQMPLLASSFLLLGLACAGFPGTLGFIGGELLLEAAVTSFPYAGFLIVLATAISGIAVLRMYFSLFCGRADVSIPTPFRRRKTFVFATLVVVLLAGGLAPKTIVDSRASAARSLLAERARRAFASR
jgi:NADH-quinone oxidoreductase subunit M